ncbi:hypothetical protein Bbelb_273760 [Branchiostoma belcheri]|nr:hypothetical protein Bbelb_273760 [Branchiostoma belcheri]
MADLRPASNDVLANYSVVQLLKSSVFALDIVKSRFYTQRMLYIKPPNGVMCKIESNVTSFAEDHETQATPGCSGGSTSVPGRPRLALPDAEMAGRKEHPSPPVPHTVRLR